MNTEDKLKAIIDAQVDAGYDKYYEFRSKIMVLHDNGTMQDMYSGGMPPDIHCLQILLDTQGLKAAYGEEKNFYQSSPVHSHIGQELEKWHWVARSIHEAWHTGGGNNFQEAINVAFSLLPDAN